VNIVIELNVLSWLGILVLVSVSVSDTAISTISSRYIGNIGYGFNYIESYWQYRYRAPKNIKVIFQTLAFIEVIS